MSTAVATPGRRLRRVAGLLNPFAVSRRRQDWVIDILIFVIAVIEIIWTPTAMAYIYDRLPDWWQPIDLAGGAVGAVALWWRRRYPLVVGYLLVPIGGLCLSAGLPAIVAVFTVTVRRRTIDFLLVTAAHLAIAIPFYFLIPLTDQFLLWVVFMVLTYGTAIGFGLAARARLQVIAGLLDSAERDRMDYEQQLQLVRQAERHQVAREMHDVLAHRISLLSVHAGALEYRTRTATEQGLALNDEEIRSSVTVIRESAHQALEELRQVLQVLRADADDQLDHDQVSLDQLRPDQLGTAPPQVTVAALPTLIGQARAAGQVITLHQTVDQDRLLGLDEQVQRTIFRTIQEGLTNARKHTPGAIVDIELSGSTESGVRVVITNPLPIGTTKAEIPGAGVGLTGLAERVRLDGGRLSRDVADGRFVLTARLPWRS
ncbi:sensor histidine kinase [Microlunatus speluncae]|uniref:sensor histidine kinase n=1 Tax=Microlunatus speluncae TaxID=2594267 RepID=UPI00126652DA|nr:histidine kinase [Microlunatus speluncae]